MKSSFPIASITPFPALGRPIGSFPLVKAAFELPLPEGRTACSSSACLAANRVTSVCSMTPVLSQRSFFSTNTSSLRHEQRGANSDTDLMVRAGELLCKGMVQQCEKRGLVSCQLFAGDVGETFRMTAASAPVTEQEVPSEPEANPVKQKLARLLKLQADLEDATADREAILAELVQGLKEQDQEVRFMTILILGKVADERAIALLIDVLDDGESLLSHCVSELLEGIGEPAVQPLLQKLEGSPKDVRAQVTAILGQIGKPAIPALIEALGHDDLNVRVPAMEALRMIGGPAVGSIIAFLERAQDQSFYDAVMLLGNIGAPAIPLLLGKLGGPDERMQARAQLALSIMGQVALPHLLMCLGDPREGVRNAAVGALGSMYQRAVPGLLLKLRDEQHVVRESAIKALLEIGAPAVPLLIAALEDDDDVFRASVAIILGMIRDERAYDPLMRLLEEPVDIICFGAVTALGELGDPRAMERLMVMRGDSRTNVREAVLSAVLKLSHALTESSETSESKRRIN